MSNSLYQTYNLSLEGISHGFTTRQGGVSHPPYQSFNLKYPTQGETESYEAVLKNREVLAQELDFDLNKLVACQQVHGNHVHLVQKEDHGRGAFQHHEGLPETDALITDQIGVALMVMVADCVPILIADTFQGVIAAVHAGWRGTAQQILNKTLKLMQSEYGCKASNIQVAIGPSIGQCCFEVDREVVEHFKDQINTEDPKFFQAKETKFFPNLKLINQFQASQAGLPQANIQIIDTCTHCTEDFYSFRRDKGVTGRFAGVICLS